MAEKQGEVKKITQKDAHEFKGDGDEVKKGNNPPLYPSQEGNIKSGSQEGNIKGVAEDGIKRTSIITIQHGRPTRLYFEDGKQVRAEPIS